MQNAASFVNAEHQRERESERIKHADAIARMGERAKQSHEELVRDLKVKSEQHIATLTEEVAQTRTLLLKKRTPRSGVKPSTPRK